ncbi:MAG: PSD1 and planctomycete cytochrome C domain-containing protein [Planctomycetota bacterium]|nr:PSD1 and planctomycete cytochrome C domain-containing protein [Planctomycetota bacterium]
MRFVIRLLSIFALPLLGHCPHAFAAEPVDFTRQIKPILQRYCVSCHGAEMVESGLRVDFGSLVLQGGDRGATLVAGDAEKSLLYQVLVGKGPVPQMPFELPKLSADQIALVKVWIEQGAKAAIDDKPTADGRPRSDHWAFQTIVRPEIPAVENSDWQRNEIDAFVLARLQQEGLQPSPEADRSTLIRRLCLDLLGVLPTPEETHRFINDDQPFAYERLVDRLLVSPRFGERWGRHWLDIARYADSNGFTIGARSIWPYRDWVIKATNDDMPFDQFVIQQLAGDLLPKSNRDQVVATGFHRNTLINQEGGTDQEQFRVEAIVDRVSTTGSAFLGLTVGCAQCHVHKYDPITQRDFYQLFAIFNNCDEPNIPLPSESQAAEQARVKTGLVAISKQLKEHDAMRASGQPDWETQQAAVPVSRWEFLKPVDAVSEAGATLNNVDEYTLLVGGNGNIPATDVYVITTEIPAGRFTAFRLETLTGPLMPMKGPGWADNGNFVLNEFEVTTQPRGGDGGTDGSSGTKLEFATVSTDWQQEGYPAEHAIDGNMKTGWAVDGTTKSSPNVSREAVFVLKQPIESAAPLKVTIKLHQQHNIPKYLIGTFRLSVTSALPEHTSIPASIRKILQVERDKRDEGQQELIEAAYGRSDSSRKPLEAQQAKLKGEESELKAAVPTTMVLSERAKNPRETHIHIRGNFLEKGALVQPNVPSILPPIESAETPVNRLDFAQWLFRPEHPLTSRVSVNRIWQRFFGIGLVATDDDFGTQGERPSHPELLDRLASEFMRLEWSQKKLLRLIVTSATYRQSSRVTPDLLKRDPRNRLLARQSRIRLEAEGVRDVALSACGLLSQKMLGPGVYPPQPKGIYVVTQVSKQWPESKGEDRYRRGLYTWFWRSSPYPMLPTFDAPDANSACTRRNRSNTPLQALTLANDGAFLEFAQALSDRIIRDASEYDDARIKLAFDAVLARPPSDFENSRLLEFVTSQRKHFESNPEDAKSAASPTRPAKTAEAVSATWTAVARVILNLDEFITRE